MWPVPLLVLGAALGLHGTVHGTVRGATLGAEGPGCGQAHDGEAVLGVLLPLSRPDPGAPSGAVHATRKGCGAPSLRGAQMEAAIRAALDRVNRDLRREGISISIRIMDTCAQPDEAVKAAMRALVASDQTCLRPPLFLGLIGPEDPNSLDAALKVTAVFDAVHVVPWGDGSSASSGVLHVAKLDAEERAQGVLLLVRRLRWPSFLLVHAEDSVSEDVSAEVARLAEEEADVCAQRRILRLAADGRGDSDVAWTMHKDNSGGVVLIAGSAERASAVLARLTRLSPQREIHVLLAVRRAEAATIADLGELKGVAITLIQEVSPTALIPANQRTLLVDSPLWKALREPDVTGGLDQDNQDASVGALAVGVQLLGAALRAALRIKCPTPVAPVGAAAGAVDPNPDAPPPSIFCPALHAMAPDEWRSILARVTAFSDSPGKGAATSATAATKLRFGMAVRSAARVLVKQSDSEYFVKAGLLVGGKDLQLAVSRSPFPKLRAGVDADCGRQGQGGQGRGSASSSGTTVSATSTPPRAKSHPTLERHPRTTPAPQSGFGSDWSWILGGAAEDSDMWTMIYTLAGAAGVMLVVFLCCFYIVYRNFRVQAKPQDDGSQSPPVSRASASRRSSGSS